MATPPPVVIDPLVLPEPVIHTPRILCLHGGGTNAEVFRLQCRSMIARLTPATTEYATPGQPRFRLIFVNAPYFSAPHTQIMSAFGSMGPFRRWLRWQEDQEEMDGDAVARDTLEALRDAILEDDTTLSRQGKKGGEWVGILGFSQGAKIAMSMLWAQERAEADGATKPEDFPLGVRLGFGVLMAGRAPVVKLIPNAPPTRGVADMGQLSSAFTDWPLPGDEEHKVQRTPMLHVHGLQDPGLEQHRRLFREYCGKGAAACIEWDGEHRLPIKTVDVEPVVAAIIDLAQRAGVKF